MYHLFFIISSHYEKTNKQTVRPGQDVKPEHVLENRTFVHHNLDSDSGFSWQYSFAKVS